MRLTLVPCRIWRRKRTERARYHQLQDPVVIEGPWVKTRVFDPYAETDFRTPTNQLEFDADVHDNTYSASLVPRSPGRADEAQVTRNSSYSVTSTLVGMDEGKGKEVGYGEKPV